jgi:AhpD family alkylhydroperoxidase
MVPAPGLLRSGGPAYDLGVEQASAAPGNPIGKRPTHPGAIMSPRLNAFAQSPELFKKFVEFTMLAKSGTIEKSILDLVDIRASQINGCGFCLDMHIKQAKLAGERELRLHHVAIWRESNQFSARERACLAWTEALTTLGVHGVPTEVYERVRGELSEKEISDLSFAVMAINGWNRLNVGFQTVPGSADKAYGLDKAQFN